MDQIIFFKEGKNLKEVMSRIRLSYTRSYEIRFADNLEKLKTHLRAKPSSLLLFFTDTLNQKERIIIRNIQAAFDDVRICLFSDRQYALDAWQLHLFHFDCFPIDNKKVIQCYGKYISEQGQTNKEFVIKTKEGIIKTAFRSVNYLKANGNYTTIVCNNGKKHTLTKQLQFFMHCTEEDVHMIRVHRSIILNIKNIRSIGKQKVDFFGESDILDLSKSLEVKVKNILLGKT